MGYAVDMAIRAARVQLRKVGTDPDTASAEAALEALADLARSEADVLAAIWYSNASAKQRKAFKSEWKQWQQDPNRREPDQRTPTS